MDILAAENDIVSKLSTDITTLDVQSFLRDPSEFKLMKRKGIILVRNLGSDFQEASANKKKNVHQIRLLTWSIVVAYKGPRVRHFNTAGTESIYTFVTSIQDSLTGYTVSTDDHFSVLEPVDDRFVGEFGGVFYWEMTFRHQLETYKAFQT